MRKSILLVLFALLAIGALVGQTNPTAQAIPYTQDFSALDHAGTTYPAGLQGWTVSTAPGATFNTSAPTADRNLIANSTASTTSGNVHNYNGKIGFLNTGSLDLSLVLALDTSSKQNINVSYNAMTIRNPYGDGTNNRINEITLQYRVGTSGTFTTLTGVEYQNNTTLQNTAVTTPQNVVNKSITLPSECDNQPVVQIRWVSRQVSGNGSRPSFAIDDISVTGSTASVPTINVTGLLSAFSTYTGTPSASQSYTLSGSNLTANIAVAALAGYEYSTDNATWSSTLSLASTFNGLVYVRLTGATAGTYNGDIVHSSTGATNVNLAATGTVSAPTPTITLGGTLSAFSTIVGTPSPSQSYTVAGVYLTGDINIGAVSGFEYSLSSGSGYASTLALTPTSGTVATTTIYVRLTGTTIGDYSGNIAHTSTGATQQDKAVTGSVTAPASPETFFEDNFEYTEATLLTANGWTAHSGGGTNSFTVASPGLSYASYPANSGLAAQTTGTSGEDVSRTFTAQTTGSVYASLLANLTSAHANGDYFFHLAASPVSSDFKGRIFAQTNASNMVRFGVSRAGNNTTAIWTDYVYSLNTTYLLVLKYQIVSGATNDVVSLWVNPTIGATEPAPNCVTTDVTVADAANIGGVALRQGNTTSPTPAAKYDGIRIANTWAQLWTVPATPVIHVDATELDALESIVDIASEEYRSYNLYGENLTSQMVVTAPNGFKLSTAMDGELSQSLNLPTDFNGTIYVRLFSSTTGDFSGNITHTSGSAEQVNVIVSGTCYPPAVVWNITQSLVPFTSNVGTPSENQSYSLSASNATASLVVTTTAPFELSTTGVSGWATELTLANTFNGSVYVRLNSAVPGDFNANITHTSLDASPASFAISGQTTPGAGLAWELFFSEYLEGSGSNKAIEIFNGTGATVDLSDYRYENWYNGGASPHLVSLTGTLGNGETYVIANPSASTEVLGIADATHGNISFNGNDALILRKISTDAIVDIFGVKGQDPGTEWTAEGGFTTLNKTLVRKSTVVRGVTVNPTITVPAVTTDFVTLGTEWDMYDVDTYANLGMHTFGSGVTPLAPVVVITQVDGNVVLTWDAVAGANSYRIESSDLPGSGFTTLTTVASSPWSGLASDAKKFYRVIALP